MSLPPSYRIVRRIGTRNKYLASFYSTREKAEERCAALNSQAEGEGNGRPYSVRRSYTFT